MSSSWHLRALLSLGLVLTLAKSGFADKPVAKKMSFAESKGKLVASTTFTGLFDRDAYLALSSGFPTTVVIRTYVYEKSKELPVSIEATSVRVVYDLWDEVYLARIDGPSGRKNLKLETRLEVLRLLTQMRRFSVASLKRHR